VSADRLVASMAASACRASAGWLSITWLPTADWTAMTLIECAITSCNSRAMRRRSSVTARRASSSRSRSSRSARASNTFHPGRSAAQHLRIIATATGLPRRRVDEVLGLVGLADAAGRRVGGFSLGMRQRLSLAGALLGDPGVLVFDEPLNGLDPDGIRWLRGLLRELAAENRTVFVSSHLLSEVAQTVDDVVVLTRGRLRAQTTLADLVARTSVVRVRTPDPARLLDVLAAAGHDVRLVDGSTVEARSATADAVGMAAAAAGVTILELSRQDEDLESLFFDLVHQNQQNHQNQEIAA